MRLDWLELDKYTPPPTEVMPLFQEKIMKLYNQVNLGTSTSQSGRRRQIRPYLRPPELWKEPWKLFPWVG